MAPFVSATVAPYTNTFGYEVLDVSYDSSVLAVNNMPDAEFNWANANENIPYGPSHPCYTYAERVKEDRKKGLVVFHQPYNFSSQHTLPDMNHLSTWSKCHLLSLPKEIRLEIWRYVLTDPSTPELLVNIVRGPSSPYKRHPRPVGPNYKASLNRTSPVNLNLLRVNRSIYKEALPVLYRDARFAPWDLEGILPMFLDSLSPFARSSIRHMKLFLPQHVTSPAIRLDPSRPFFNWAITCAQVAKLNGSLHSVEVEGDWSIFDIKGNRRAIIAPLLKIKGKKTFTHRPKCFEPAADFSNEFKVLLTEVEQHLKATAEVRKQRTEADALDRAIRTERLEQEKQAIIRELEATKAQRVVDKTAGEDHALEEWRRLAEGSTKSLDAELSLVAGITQFEKELALHSSPEDSNTANVAGGDDEEVEEWDLVSVRSGNSTPKARPGSVMSSNETWTDTASTIVGKDGDEKEWDESDAESENWEEL
jgi:hypothetical protein